MKRGHALENVSEEFRVDGTFRIPESRRWRKLRTALALPVREKVWLALLFPSSALVRAALLFLPFRRLASCLGAHHGNIQLSSLASQDQVRLAARIGSLIDSVSRFTPWETRCLAQAILIRMWLVHYRIPHVVYLGIAKPGNAKPGIVIEGALRAHAWVAVGPKVVAGRDGHRAFTVVSTFASPGLLRPC